MSEEKKQVQIDEASPVQLQANEEGEDAINEKKLLKKIDLHIVPMLTALFFLSFNVGNVRIDGLAADTHMTENQFLTTLSVYFVGYVLFQLPCNIALRLTSPRFWLPTLVLAWGIVCTLIGITQNFAGLLAVRLFLGVAESGFFPGAAFYMSMWYKRNEQHYRISLLVATATLSGAFGGLFADVLAKMGGIGGLGGWRWVFKMEGLLTVVNSIPGYFFIYNYPATATCLTPGEREYVLTRLEDDGDATRDEKFTWQGVIQALTDPKIYLYGLCFHTLRLPGYTISLFIPTAIDDLGYSSTQAQLLSIPPYAIAFITTIVVAVLAGKTGRRAPFIIGGAAGAIIGYILLISSTSPGVAYAGTIIVTACTFPSSAIVLSWPANNVSGQTKRATAHAMQFSIGNLGAIIGIQLYQPKWGPRYFVGHGTAIGYLFGNIVVVGILWYVMERENERRDRDEQDDQSKGVGGDTFLGDEDPRWRFLT